MRSDGELLRDYAEGHSEAAFDELVRRHVIWSIRRPPGSSMAMRIWLKTSRKAFYRRSPMTNSANCLNFAVKWPACAGRRMSWGSCERKLKWLLTAAM